MDKKSQGFLIHLHVSFCHFALYQSPTLPPQYTKKWFVQQTTTIVLKLDFQVTETNTELTLRAPKIKVAHINKQYIYNNNNHIIIVKMLRWRLNLAETYTICACVCSL